MPDNLTGGIRQTQLFTGYISDGKLKSGVISDNETVGGTLEVEKSLDASLTSNGELSGGVQGDGHVTAQLSSNAELVGSIALSFLHGLSAYEIAVEHGFIGTEEEWLESLIGDAATIEIGSVVYGNELSIANSGDEHHAIFDFVIPKGKSAYEYAVEGGYEGTEEEFAVFLASAKIYPANATTLGGIKADTKTDSDTVSASIGEDYKLYVPTYPNVFRTVRVGDDAVTAKNQTDTLTLCAGSDNVSLSASASDNSITIDARGEVVYVHTQPTPSKVWQVQHNLGKYPSITIVDSAGTQVEGDVDYTDTNNCILTFEGAFSGKAFCN